MLPRGKADLLRQVAVFCGAYWLYRLVRGIVVDQPEAAIEHARHLVELERSLGLYVEPAVHEWAMAQAWVGDAATWAYVNTHFVVTTVTLAWLYLRRNDVFPFVRNMFVVAMAIALAGYVLYPTAPPRLVPEGGFSDPVSELTGGESDGPLVNPYAAVPSMHVGFALMLAGAMWRVGRSAWVRGAWAAYPAVVTFVVVATANHWWMDAALGAAAAAVAALCARAMARPWALGLRPSHGPPAPHHRA